MVELKARYSGVDIVINADSGIKTLMADAIAAIDYLQTRETVGKYSGKSETETPKEDAPKKSPRASKSKADDKPAKVEPEAKAEEQTEQVAAETDLDEENTDSAPGEPEDLTLDDVREAVMAYTEVKGAVAGKKLVSDVGGATKLSEVKPAKYAALVKAAKAGV